MREAPVSRLRFNEFSSLAHHVRWRILRRTAMPTAAWSIGLRPLFERHSVGKGYVLKNYREVLCRMEREGKIRMEPPFDKRQAGTIGPKVKIIFPHGGGT
jgi:hypothetical protein